MHVLRPATLVLISWAALLCEGRAAAQTSIATVPDPSAPVATVGGRAISGSDLLKRVRGRLAQLEQERYDAMRAGLEELVGDELLRREAAARKTSVEALVKEEVDAKALGPSEADIAKFYADNKDAMGGATLEQERPKIVRFLREPRVQERRAAFLSDLRGKYGVNVALKAPRVEVATAGRPERGGGPKAPVTMVMFSDFQCSYCKQARPVLEQVMKTYGDKVRLVARDFPLSIHPDARPAAEAAACANAQGKYWEYHDLLFANQAALGEAKLAEYAKQAGLDGPKFDRCLMERPHSGAIDRDLEDAADAGINGTPVFVVNGRMLLGVLPFAAFKEAIDEALAGAALGPPSAGGSSGGGARDR